MISVKEFHRPKLGNSDVEYEDAFACSPEQRRFAIADGASDSIFSGVWASSLVKTFSESKTPMAATENYLRRIIYSARKKWYNSIDWSSLKLFVKNKALNGSFSTFLGAEIKGSGSNLRCKVISVGDSCIFIRKSDGVLSFPIDNPKNFNITPKLIWSGYGNPFPEQYHSKVPVIEHFEAKIEPGDSILVATDAISKWILEHLPSSLDRLSQNGNSYDFITGMMEARELRNDDITFSWIILDS